MLGIGGAISAGVFITLGHAATLAGTALIIAIVLCGIINLLTMLSYAELGAALPSAGGEYSYAKASFGGFPSFATGWFEWISNLFFAALSAVGFAYLLSYVIPSLNIPLTAVAIVVVFSLINIRGIKETGLAQTLLVLLLLVLLLVFIVWGLFGSQGVGTFEIRSPEGFFGVMKASAFIFVVYLGGEAIAVAQGEIKNPGKNIPRAILITCTALILIYTATAFVVLKTIPVENIASQTSPLAYVAEKVMGPIGVGVITIAGIIAALSSVNTSTMAHSRVAYALARDGYFPKSFFMLHKRFCTPVVAIIIGSFITALVGSTGVVTFVAYAADFGFIIGFALVNLSLIKLRRTQPNLHRPFRVPLYPLTPILGIMTSLLLIFFLDPGTLLIGLELLILGLVVYYLKMVGYYRIVLAMGGMNFGVCGFSALFASLLASDVNIVLSGNAKFLLFIFAILICITSLLAGVLSIIRKNNQ